MLYSVNTLSVFCRKNHEGYSVVALKLWFSKTDIILRLNCPNTVNLMRLIKQRTKYNLKTEDIGNFCGLCPYVQSFEALLGLKHYSVSNLQE